MLSMCHLPLRMQVGNWNAGWQSLLPHVEPFARCDAQLDAPARAATLADLVRHAESVVSPPQGGDRRSRLRIDFIVQSDKATRTRAATPADLIRSANKVVSHIHRTGTAGHGRTSSAS